jgi:hypothetical protein
MPQLLDLVTLVAPFAPNVPAFTAANAIREAARTFYGAVPALTEFVEVETEVGVMDYDIYSSYVDTEVTAILGVERSPFDKLTYVSDVGRVQSDGKPYRYTTLRTRQVRLLPTPNSVETLRIQVALRPTFDASEIDDEAFNYDAEIIKYGAISILKSQPNTDWSAPQDAAYFRRDFEGMMNDRRIEIAQSHNTEQLTANVNNFL